MTDLESPGKPAAEDPGRPRARANGALALPAAFGPFRLLRRLGEGGASQVYLAEQPPLGRQVVLKLIPPGSVHFLDARERLLAEARALALLDHPGICPLLEMGACEGIPYLAMPYLEGESLAAWIRRAREAHARQEGPPALVLPAAEERPAGPARRRGPAAAMAIVGLIEKVALALDAAHEAGFVHGDVKPANIVLTRNRGPVLLDFGLALPMAAGARGAGDVPEAAGADLAAPGTPAYRAPELAADPAARRSRLTDVFSLGATLFEALTLVQPFQAPTLETLHRNLASGRRPDPRRLNPQIPRSLAVVLATALATDPARRYRTALELARDLERVRTLKPIAARRPPAAARAWQWARRQPLAAGLLGAVTAALGVTVLLLAGLGKLHRETEALHLRSRAMAMAETANDIFQRNQALAIRLARTAALLEPGPRTLSRLQDLLARMTEQTVLGGHSDLITNLAFAPKGGWMATVDDRGVCRLWSESGRLQATLRDPEGMPAHPGRKGVLFAPDGLALLTWASRRPARLWDASGRLLASFRDPGADIWAALFLDSGSALLLGLEDGALEQWDLEGSLRSRRMVGKGGRYARVQHLAAARDGSLVVAASMDHELLFLDAAGRTLVHCHGPAEAQLFSLALSPDGARVAVGDGKGRIWFRDRQGRIERSFPAHGHRVTILDFAPDGRHLLSAGLDKTVKLWTPEGAYLSQPVSSEGTFTQAAFLADSRRILVSGPTRSTFLVDKDGFVDQVFPPTGGLPSQAACSPDGGKILVGHRDGTARLWNPDTRFIPRLDLGLKGAASLDLDPRGAFLVATSRGSAPRAFDLAGRLLFELPHRTAGGDKVFLVHFLPGGNRILTADTGGGVGLWSRAGTDSGSFRFSPTMTVADAAGDGAAVAVGPAQKAIEIHLPDRDDPLAVGLPVLEGRILTASFTPDGGRIWILGQRWVALADRQGAARVFPAPRAQPLRRFAISPDGRTLALIAEHGALLLWTPEDEVEPRRAAAGRSFVCVRMSPDGEAILAGTSTGDILLLDDAGGIRLRLEAHEAPVRDVLFVPGAARLISTAEDGTAILWARSGGFLLRMTHPGDVVDRAIFEPGTERVITVTRQGTVRIWYTRPADILGLAADRYPILGEEEATRLVGLPPPR